MTTQYWLVKQEPSDFSWDDFTRDGRAAWTGVRNYGARNHLRAMRAGDEVFFYHSGEDRAVVGLARVAKPAYPDPTADDDTWSAVDLEPVRPLAQPVTLAQIKADPALREMILLRQSRLSVTPVTAAERKRLLTLASSPANP